MLLFVWKISDYKYYKNYSYLYNKYCRKWNLRLLFYFHYIQIACKYESQPSKQRPGTNNWSRRIQYNVVVLHNPRRKNNQHMHHTNQIRCPRNCSCSLIWKWINILTFDNISFKLSKLQLNRLGIQTNDSIVFTNKDFKDSATICINQSKEKDKRENLLNRTLKTDYQ